MNWDEVASYVTQVQKHASRHQIEPTTDVAVLLKDGDRDFTTAVDIAVGKELKQNLRMYGFDFIGEEEDVELVSSRYAWIVDPTDGTAVFKTGGEYFRSSIALVDRKEEQVVFGSVYQPQRKRQFIRTPEQFWVEQTVQAVNGSPLVVKRRPEPSQTRGMPELLVCAFFPTKYNAPDFKAKVDAVFVKEAFPELGNREYGIINARPASGSSADWTGRRRFQ